MLERVCKLQNLVYFYCKEFLHRQKCSEYGKYVCAFSLKSLLLNEISVIFPVCRHALAEEIDKAFFFVTTNSKANGNLSFFMQLIKQKLIVCYYGGKTMECSWINQPDIFEVTENRITMVAPKNTNLFNSPSGTFQCADFPYYYSKWQGDFVVRCQITPAFKALYDLGSIVVWENEQRWIKFAYENTDNGYPAMVSVVTQDYSDDCNGSYCEGSIWMQISRQKYTFALHFSEDKKKWLLARICRLPMSESVLVGLSAQCPMGENCKVVFEHFEISPNTYSDIRKMK